MPVNTPRTDYSARQPQWQRCRDFSEGQDAVKARKTLYLPKTSTRQTNAAYDAYLNRAYFYGATGRTISGLAGAVFAKPPAIQASEAIVKGDALDITKTGITLGAFARDLVIDQLTVGRYGVLVDMPKDAGPGTRPYWVAYKAEDIINWRTEVIAGDTVLTRVILRECTDVDDPNDPFASKEQEQYRVCELVNGTYQVTIWTRPEGKDEFVAGDTVIPIRRGAALTFIPFQFFGPNALTTDVAKPPLLDLVNTNLAHYQLWADRRQLLHYFGQVQAWVSGIAKKDAPTTWGSGSVWTMEAKEAQAGLLQMTSDGAAPLRDALTDLEQMMAILGGRLLEGQVKKQEAAETVRLRRAGDLVTLSDVGQTASHGLSQLVRWHAWWAGDTQDVRDADISVGLNTDFASARLTAEEIKSLVLAVQAGQLSGETFYYALTRGDWTEPGIDYKAELQRIAATDDAGDGDPEDKAA